MGTPNSSAGRIYWPVDFTTLPPPRNIFANGSNGSYQLLQGAGLVTAMSFGEDSGSGASHAYLHDGTDTTGYIVACIFCIENAGFSMGPGMPGIPYYDGLYFEMNTGLLKGTITYIPMPQGF